MNEGDGTFAPAASYDPKLAGTSVAVGDLDRDGWPDLVATNEGLDSVSVLINNGDGTFGSTQRYAAGGYPHSVAIVALNGDGRPDLGVANRTGYVSVFLNQREYLIGDIDRDGDVDWHDLLALLLAYGTCEGDASYEPGADLDGSGCITLRDLAELLGNYGASA